MARKRRIPKPENFEPELIITWGSRKGSPRCLAWNSNHGRQCKKPPMRVADGGHPAAPATHCTVCERDGGKSLRGIASPSLLHGKNSKYVSSGVRSAVERALSDKDLLNLSHNIAVSEGRLDQLQRQLDASEAPPVMLHAIAKAYRSFQSATARKDRRAMGKYLSRLEELIERGDADHLIWQAHNEQAELHRRLVESEVKRRIAMKGTLDIADARGAYIALGMAVKLVITTHFGRLRSRFCTLLDAVKDGDTKAISSGTKKVEALLVDAVVRQEIQDELSRIVGAMGLGRLTSGPD